MQHNRLWGSSSGEDVAAHASVQSESSQTWINSSILIAGVNNVPAQASLRQGSIHSLAAWTFLTGWKSAGWGSRNPPATAENRAQVDSHTGGVLIHQVAESVPWATAKQTHSHKKKKKLHILHSVERMWLITWSVLWSFIATCKTPALPCQAAGAGCVIIRLIVVSDRPPPFV